MSTDASTNFAILGLGISILIPTFELAGWKHPVLIRCLIAAGSATVAVSAGLIAYPFLLVILGYCQSAQRYALSHPAVVGMSMIFVGTALTGFSTPIIARAAHQLYLRVHDSWLLILMMAASTSDASLEDEARTPFARPAPKPAAKPIIVIAPARGQPWISRPAFFSPQFA